jgi:hypothetical protein
LLLALTLTTIDDAHQVAVEGEIRAPLANLHASYIGSLLERRALRIVDFYRSVLAGFLPAPILRQEDMNESKAEESINDPIDFSLNQV